MGESAVAAASSKCLVERVSSGTRVCMYFFVTFHLPDGRGCRLDMDGAAGVWTSVSPFVRGLADSTIRPSIHKTNLGNG